MGAFLIGVAFGLSKDGPLSSQAWTLVVIGALGGYTTYSTYALETLEQFADGRTGGGLLNAFGQLAVSLITAYLGVLLVRGFQGMGGSIYELLFRSQDTLSRTLASIHRDAERDCLEKRAEAHR